MSIATLFTKKRPSLGGEDPIEFDAILEDTYEGTVEITDYPIEVGTRAADHRVIKPQTWKVTIGISNNPVKTGIADFAGALPIPTAITGLASGFLADNNSSRTAEALQRLREIKDLGEPFTIIAEDFTLDNMLIVSIRRINSPENDGALIADIELKEYLTLDRIKSKGAINTNPEDVASKQSGSLINQGQKQLEQAGQSIQSAVDGFIGVF